MAYLLWITGLAGSGKSSIACELYCNLKKKDPKVVLFDGDSFREVLGNDLGYCPKDRKTSALRLMRMCHFLVNQELNVLCATISLFHDVHQCNRENISNYFEVYVDVDMEELRRRDQKGLYSQGSHVAGIDQSYDVPLRPDLILKNNEEPDLKKNISIITKLIEGVN